VVNSSSTPSPAATTERLLTPEARVEEGTMRGKNAKLELALQRYREAATTRSVRWSVGLKDWVMHSALPTVDALEHHVHPQED
jgi:hypothetical protein